MPRIAGKEVGPIGFGLLSLTRRGSTLSDEDAFAVLRAALAAGANFWNGGEFYGPETNNSLVLLAKYFERYPEDADRVVLSIKGGMPKPLQTLQPDSSRANVLRSALDCQKQLQGRKTMELFEVARQDGKTPWAETAAAFRELMAQGVFTHVGLSETKPGTVELVHDTLVPVAACEEELSLMTRDVLIDGVAAACAARDIPLVAYSPMGRGLLTGAVRGAADVPALVAQMLPRMQGDNLTDNLKMADAVATLASKKGCTPAQLAINWARCQSLRPGMPTVIPIPGGSTVAKVQENSTVVDLTLADLDEIDAVIACFEVKGDRHAAGFPGKS